MIHYGKFISRFSEKSFEIRFCAALSAALMPFNRNPQWFGMTQAEERRNGIDAMLGIGGRLILFQFKAKQNNKFRLGKHQWNCLTNTETKHPNSTFYVFPEASNVSEADSVSCILRHSWFCSPSNPGISNAFKPSAASATVSLNTSEKCLQRQRPELNIPVITCCDVMGCYCPPASFRYSSLRRDRDSDKKLLYFLTSGESPHAFKPLILPGREFLGIKIDKVSRDNRKEKEMMSVRMLEELFGDWAHKTLSPGLYGLFLPK